MHLQNSKKVRLKIKDRKGLPINNAGSPFIAQAKLAGQSKQSDVRSGLACCRCNR